MATDPLGGLGRAWLNCDADSMDRATNPPAHMTHSNTLMRKHRKKLQHSPELQQSQLCVNRGRKSVLHVAVHGAGSVRVQEACLLGATAGSGAREPSARYVWVERRCDKAVDVAWMELRMKVQGAPA